jgi:large subunit ribosomal protein L25
MEIIKLSAERRAESGKGPASRLRRAGKIPAIAYGATAGKGTSATPLAVSPKELRSILASVYGQNSVIELSMTGSQPITVMVRDYSYHPVTRELVHADFMQVQMDAPVDVDVPCKTIGKAPGVQAGGRLEMIFRRIPIRCLPDKIPSVIEIDVEGLELNETVKARQLVLPEGVTVRFPEDKTLAVVHQPEKATEEETAAAEAAAAAATPGAAAPAAAEEPSKATK